MHSRTVAFGGALAAAVILATVSQAGSLAAPTSAPTGNAAYNSETPAFWDTQNKLIAIASQIEKTGTSDGGFSSVAIDPGADTVTVYRVAAKEASDPSKIYGSVSLGDAKLAFSPALLTQSETLALTKLIQDKPAALTSNGFDIQGSGPDPTVPGGGPFVVYYSSSGPSPSAAATTALTTYGANTVRFEPTKIGSLDRYGDTSPFFGGDQTVGASQGGASNYAICSSAFGGRSSTNGNDYVITAAHCVKPADPRVWAGFGQQQMGLVTTYDLNQDIAYVNTALVSRQTAPFVWDEFHGSSPSDSVVTGSEAPVNGEVVCSSGAKTQLACNETVRGLGSDWTSTNAYTSETHFSYPGFLAIRANNGVAGAGGDSGGAIFRVVSAGNDIAVGMVSAGYGPVTCPTWVGNSDLCFNTIFSPYLNQYAAINHHLDFSR